VENKSSELGNTLASLSRDVANSVERVGRSVVAVHARPRTPSSGVYWRGGVVVTANHTVKREEDITIVFSDGRTAPAELAGRDAGTDLAILKLQGEDLPIPEIGDASLLRAGDLILALGRGESGQGGPVASLGLVSAVGGAWRTWRGGQIDQFIRLDTSIFLGFSGGPLVDAHGRIAGINSTGLWRGVGMSVPASTVERVTKELAEKGRIARGYLGLGMQPVRVPEGLRSKLSLAGNGGMIVISVEPEGPAEKAGVFIGDVLVGLEHKPVADIGDVQAFLGSDRIGKAVNASIIRGGQLVELAILLEERLKGGR
jgi:S1-C subfamily serine protease